MIEDYIKKVEIYLPELIQSLQESLVMLVISVVAAILIGLPLGTLIYLNKKKNISQNKILIIFINSFVDIIRSFPFLLLVVAIIPFTRLIFGTAFGTYAASFPLSLVAIALYTRLVENVLLEIPSEVFELAQSLGANKLQLIFRFLYVEARSGLILMLTSVSISMISYSTIMGVVGGGGIGDFAIRYGYQRYEYELMYTAIVLIIIFVSFIQKLGNYLAKKLNKKP